VLKNKIIDINELAKKHNLYFFASLIFAVTILVLSVIPGFAGGINTGVSAHGLAYFVFSLTAALYFRANRFKSPLLKAVLLAGLYGVFIEFVQYFISYRQFDVGDIFVNFSAALIAVIPNFVLMQKQWI
jgi:hypothetical protein